MSKQSPATTVVGIIALLCLLLQIDAFQSISSSSCRRPFSLQAKKITASTSEIRTKTPKRRRHEEDDTVFDGDKEAAEEARRKAFAEKREKNMNSLKNRDDPEWKFFDTARLHVSGGDGGNGCVAFLRERGNPLGGPAGGRGGSGGNIYLECNEGLNTLAPLRDKVHVSARKGSNGLGKNKDGAKGKSILVAVPPGTLVRDLKTQKVAGELRNHGERLLVARGGRGGRGNHAFLTNRNTAPRIAERGEPGDERWISVELRLVADVGFLGFPNAGKSTLLAAASAARPKIANYPFTTIIPNLGVCDIDEEGAGLVLCDIPGLIEGASQGAGLGPAFLRHVQRCKVLLHMVDGTSPTPVEDFKAIQNELVQFDEFLGKKPQVVVLNKIDIPEVKAKEEEILAKLREAAGHSRVLSISAATTERVKELMIRLKKFVSVQPEAELPPPPEIDFSKQALDFDSDDFEILSDPAYPGQWRVSGQYIEQIAKMTHWEYPEAIARFGRQLDAMGISSELERRGAAEGDLVMIGDYDFDFAPAMTNPYLPPELIEEEKARMAPKDEEEKGEPKWRPFTQGGLYDVDSEEFVGFNEAGDWDLLDDQDFADEEFEMDDAFTTNNDNNMSP